MNTVTEFDKELENITISEDWIGGELMGEPLGNYPEAIKAIKQAVDKQIPSASTIALLFHKTYEELAPQFGYETREDTKEFDPYSANGKLMTAVAEAVRESLWGKK